MISGTFCLGRIFAMLSLKVERNAREEARGSLVVDSSRVQVLLTPSARALIVLDALRMLRGGAESREFHIVDGGTISGRIVRMGGEAYLGEIGGVRCAADFEVSGDADGRGSMEFLLRDPGPNELDLQDPVVCAGLFFEDERAAHVGARVVAARREKARIDHLRDPRYN